MCGGSRLFSGSVVVSNRGKAEMSGPAVSAERELYAVGRSRGVCMLVGVGVSSAWAQPASIDRVTSAVAALGGEQAMRGLNSLLIQGEAKYSEPEESFTPGGTPRFLGDASFTLSWQLALGWARIDWNRSTQYPTVKKFQYTEVLTQRFGFIEDTNGIRPVRSETCRAIARARALLADTAAQGA